MVPGKWGFCSRQCLYCSGAPIEESSSGKIVDLKSAKQDYETEPSQECGYDCLFNSRKWMIGSEGWLDYWTENDDLIAPSAYLNDFIDETNYIENKNGNHMVRLKNLAIQMFTKSLI